MSRINAQLPNPCYEANGFWMGAGLAKPSKQLFKENLDRLLGPKRGRAAELARYVGVDPAMVALWRGGKNAPEVERLSKIAEFFGVPVTELFLDPTDERTTGITLDVALNMISEAVKKAQQPKD